MCECSFRLLENVYFLLTFKRSLLKPIHLNVLYIPNSLRILAQLFYYIEAAFYKLPLTTMKSFLKY